MKSQGFTLIELIIILVIIGILAVSVSPVFFGNSGTQSLVLRQRVISILRSIQLQAMQDTNTSYAAAVSEDTLGVPPFTDENDRQVSAPENIVFSFSGSLPATIGFDGLGKPTQDCNNGCIITLTENSGASREIHINSEGFIDAR